MTPRHLIAPLLIPTRNTWELHRGICTIWINKRATRYLVHLNIDSWTISGKLKLWKRDPDRFRLPIRQGAFGRQRGDYVIPSNVHQFHWAKECPMRQAYALLWMETGSDELPYSPQFSLFPTSPEAMGC